MSDNQARKKEVKHRVESGIGELHKAVDIGISVIPGASIAEGAEQGFVSGVLNCITGADYAATGTNKNSPPGAGGIPNNSAKPAPGATTEIQSIHGDNNKSEKEISGANINIGNPTAAGAPNTPAQRATAGSDSAANY